jgi:hypothetical protein
MKAKDYFAKYENSIKDEKTRYVAAGELLMDMLVEMKDIAEYYYF